MFKQKDKNEPQSFGIKEVETIIGPTVKVKGDFESAGNIIVEGTLEGSIKTKGNVLIGDQARITGNVTAKEARIGGEVAGNIKTKDSLEVAASAKILGDIKCSLLTVEPGAQLNGKCKMGEVEMPKKNTEEIEEGSEDKEENLN